MQTTIEIKIEKVSAKGAMLITDGSKSCWIMPKMKRADGTFTAGAYKALAEAKTKTEWVAEKKAEEAAVKEANSINGNSFRSWTPSADYGRVYFADKSFITVSSKDRAPRGYYEAHRYCKGEEVTVTFVTATEGMALACLPFITTEHLGYMVPSGQSKVMVEDGENWKQI